MKPKKDNKSRTMKQEQWHKKGVNETTTMKQKGIENQKRVNETTIT